METVRHFPGIVASMDNFEHVLLEIESEQRLFTSNCCLRPNDLLMREFRPKNNCFLLTNVLTRPES